jgi:uncharacterized damage-inducible protein DinB
MADSTLTRAVRHNTWANLEMLSFCARLDKEQLDWSAPGTLGSIHRTLQHIVGAESFYLRLLTGAPPPEGRLGDNLVPVDDLVRREKTNGERIERVLQAAFDPDRKLEVNKGETATAGVIVAQFIHHGSDHRAHVGTILGSHGVEPPDLDVWAYGTSIGEVSTR